MAARTSVRPERPKWLLEHASVRRGCLCATELCFALLCSMLLRACKMHGFILVHIYIQGFFKNKAGMPWTQFLKIAWYSCPGLLKSMVLCRRPVHLRRHSGHMPRKARLAPFHPGHHAFETHGFLQASAPIGGRGFLFLEISYFYSNARLLCEVSAPLRIRLGPLVVVVAISFSRYRTFTAVRAYFVRSLAHSESVLAH